MYVYIRQSRSVIGTTREITIKYVLNFLSNLFNKSVSWNSIVFKKCALATKMTVELYQLLNNHLFIIIFITGVYSLKPPATKLSFVCEVSIIY